MSDQIDEKQERAAGVTRQLTGEDAPTDTDRESQVGPTGGGGGEMSPEGVGESVGLHGEEMTALDGKEAGRYDTGPDDTKAARPTGKSTPRDMTGVDPQDGPAT